MSQRQRLGKYIGLALATVLIAGSDMPAVLATSSSSSTNYEVSEMQFGAGSSLESCSGEYCARVSIGTIVDGDAASSGSKASFGPVVPDEPMLEVIVDGAMANFGELTTEQTATNTLVIRVRNYLSDGYTLQINGNPPRYGEHALDAPATPTASQPGTEQFAINATVNTTPAVGAELVQHPSGDISFGEILPDYNTPNLFSYQSGDVIARSLMASGRTDYAISMIVNIANSTPAGNYNGDFSAVVVPIF